MYICSILLTILNLSTGRHYLKIGHFRDYNLPLCPNEIASWFRGDFNPVREKAKEHLVNVFADIFPGI